MKTYYKAVIARRDGRLQSFCDNDLYGIWMDNKNVDFSVTYIPNQFVKPNVENTKLYVFNTLEDAKFFCRYSNAQIWECEVKNPTTCKFLSFLDSVGSFWKNKKKHLSVSSYAKHCPKGTRTCDAVKLLKKVN